MTASLVTLFRQRRGWTNEDRAQFARIERLLDEAGFAVDVEHGLSDEGEPWCVFCSRITGDVVIHVACIDGRFMFDSTTLPRPIEGASFQRCAERFFEDVSLPMPLSERRGKVYLHPSAMLASLFITVLLYAQATTEAPLFAAEAVDVDDPDAPTAQQSPLAVRLKEIAQQVSDFVAAGDNSQASAQAYSPVAAAAIPAGMAIAVIAIAQDLAAAQAAGLFGLDEDPELAPSSLAKGPESDQAAPVAELAVQTHEEPDSGDRAVHHLTVLSGAEAEIAAEGSSDAGSAFDMAAIADLYDDVIARVEGAAADAMELVGAVGLGGVGFGEVGEIETSTAMVEDASVTLFAEATEELEGKQTTAFDGLFDSLASLSGLDVVSETMEVAGRTVGYDVVQVTESFVAQLEEAFFATSEIAEVAVPPSDTDFDVAMTDSFDLVLEGPGTVAALPVVGVAPARAAERPLAEVVGPPLVGPETSTRFGQADEAQPVQQPGPLVVSSAERNALVERFAAEVGDFTLVRSETTEWYFDASLNGYTRTDDIEFETVWLEDGTKVTFAGAVWDFDGLV